MPPSPRRPAVAPDGRQPQEGRHHLTQEDPRAEFIRHPERFPRQEAGVGRRLVPLDDEDHRRLHPEEQQEAQHAGQRMAGRALPVGSGIGSGDSHQRTKYHVVIAVTGRHRTMKVRIQMGAVGATRLDVSAPIMAVPLIAVIGHWGLGLVIPGVAGPIPTRSCWAASRRYRTRRG